MNWNKIINIFIVIFIAINLAMYGLGQYRDELRYTISDQRLSQLRDILHQNGITLYSHVPKYFPMKKIVLETPVLDKDKIAEVIFKDETFTRTFTADNESYRSKNQQLTFLRGDEKDKIQYTGTNKRYVPKSFTQAEVERMGAKFAEDITLSIPKMKLTSSSKFKDYYLLEYNEVYKGEILFYSYVSIKISANGIEEATSHRYAPVKFTGGEVKIYSIDEALYNFMEKVHPKPGELYSIKSIDLGYDLGLGVLEENYYAEAVPYYRIKLDSSDTYYYINAFTNELRNTNLE